MGLFLRAGVHRPARFSAGRAECWRSCPVLTGLGAVRAFLFPDWSWSQAETGARGGERPAHPRGFTVQRIRGSAQTRTDHRGIRQEKHDPAELFGAEFGYSAQGLCAGYPTRTARDQTGLWT